MNATLIKDLVALVGPQRVLTQPGDLYVYSFDSALDRAIPSAVVLPANSVEVTKIIETLFRHKQTFVARGAATSLCGGPIPLNKAVVVSLARLKHIGKVDPVRQEVSVGPGVINLRLQEAVAPFKLFYAPDPGSQKACTIGGNVATNAGGPHCLKYGVTSNNVIALDVVLPNGKPLHISVNDPGYDLVGFFVGSEGTLGVVTNITVKLLPIPAIIRTMVISFRSIEDAIQSVTDIIASGILPATLEAMDKTIVAAVEAFVNAGYPLEAEAVLLIEVDGETAEELDTQVQRIKVICEKNKSFASMFAANEKERAKLWEGRRGSYAAMARLAPNVLVEDGAVPRTQLPEALRRIKQIASDAGLQVAMLFHAGDGNLHPQIIFDERDQRKTKIVKEAGHRMLKACVDLGGTISGEHGVGIDKREAMKWLFSRETLTLFRRLKNAFDPENLCNPDKLIPLIGTVPAAADFDVQVQTGMVNELGLATPLDESQLIHLVQICAKEKRAFGIQGSATKYRVEENLVVNTAHLNQVLDFDQGNLTITVQAGASVEGVRNFVEQSKQYLWVAGTGSVGGVIATRASATPPLRDQILGMRVLLPTGDVVKFGAKTMKNVAGYDAAKLLIGSWGTLGVILDVTFRLFPYPAPDMKAMISVPFVFKETHKKIKSAFDPLNILSIKMSTLTEKDVKRSDEKKAVEKEASSEDQKFLDKFWTAGQ